MPSWNKHRRDLNQKPLIAALKRCGFSVLDISQTGGSAPDLVIAKGGETMLVEIKNKHEKLRNNQVVFARDWNGKIITAYDIDDILRFTR